MTVRVQREDVEVGTELAGRTQGNCNVGGLVSFVGLVRDMADGEGIRAMTLEHYPGMTEKMLGEIEAEARARWPLEASLIVHRRSEEHTSELQSLMRISYAVFCLKKKNK